MSGIEKTAARLHEAQAGQDVAKVAKDLHARHYITDAQLKELTNGKVNDKDVAIGNAAIQKVMGDKDLGPREALHLMSAITGMNQNVLTIQHAQVMEDIRQAGTKK